MPKAAPAAKKAIGRRRIEYMPLPDIMEAARNPKAHDIPAVTSSMQRLGFIDTLILDERTGTLIAGHGRLKTLRRLRDTGAPPPEGVTVGTGGEWLVPVTRGWASADDDNARAAIVALNRTSEIGAWDDEALTDLLEELAAADPDLLNVSGFTQEDLDGLLATPEPETGAGGPAETGGQPVGAAGTGSAGDGAHVGALFEVILVFPADEHAEVRRHLNTIKERDGNLPTAQIVLAALRAAACGGENHAHGHPHRRMRTRPQAVRGG